MFDRLAVQGPTVINTLSTRTRRWAIGLAAVPLLLGVAGSGLLGPDRQRPGLWHSTSGHTPGCRSRLPGDRCPIRPLAMAGPALQRHGLRRDRHQAPHHARLRRRNRLVLPAAVRRLRRARARAAFLMLASHFVAAG